MSVSQTVDGRGMRVKLIGETARREEEVVFVTADAGEAAALRSWGLLAVVRPEDGGWGSHVLGALAGCDIVVLHRGPAEDGAWADHDAKILGGIAKRVGVLAPGAMCGVEPAHNLNEYVGWYESLELAVRSLVCEALICLGPQPVPPAQPARAESAWPPLRLGDLPPVEPFPAEVLPGPLAEFVREASEAAGAPVDFAGLAALVTAGVAVGESLALALKPDVSVPAAFQGLNVGDPSSGHTPALRAVTRVLAEVTSYTLVDGSDAALRRRLADNQRGLLVAREDATAWVTSLCTPKRGDRRANGDFWREAVFGSRGRERTPFLGFCGNITPARLDVFARYAGGGVVERLLFVFPDPSPKPYWSEGGVGEASKGAWVAALQRLAAHKPAGGRYGASAPRPVVLSAEAKEEWVAWYNARTDAMNAADFDPAERAVEVQLRDTAARLALIVHLLQDACGPSPSQNPKQPVPPVGVEALRGAFRLWSYFKSQHRRVAWVIAGGTCDSTAASILDWVRRTGRPSFSVAELTSNLRWLTGRPGEPGQSLRLLEDRHALRRRPEPPRTAGTRGRKPSPVYEVHPALVARVVEDSPSASGEGNKMDFANIM